MKRINPTNRPKNQPLTDSDLARFAPAVMASAAAEKTSGIYSFLPTIDVVNGLRDSGWLPVFARQINGRDKEHGEHMIRFTRPDLQVDGFRLEIGVYNSHNAGSSVRVYGGLFRYVCSNGMTVAVDRLEFHARHVGFSMDEFLKGVKLVGKNLDLIGDSVDRWDGLEVSPDVRQAYGKAALALLYDEPEKAPITGTALLKTRRREDETGDLWGLHNTVQENVIKGGIPGRNKETRRRMKTRPVQSLERDRRLNTALWTLTTEMEKLLKK